ncbi:MAG: MFS transporter [Francisellaceae bacterium]
MSAQLESRHPGSRPRIFTREIDSKKAIVLSFIAFLFTGFQCAIYGMLTVPIAEHFNIDANIIIFYDGFGLWGQILAMATGGMIIHRIKGKNTLMLAASLMIIGSLVSIMAPNVYIYTLMTFLCNMAVGYVLVACNYMIMGTVKSEGESEGRLSILNVFFSLGFLVSAFVVGNILFYSSWQLVFILVMLLFVVFIFLLLSLGIHELCEAAVEHKNKGTRQRRHSDFLTFPVILTALALFCIVYVEQIMNYFNQPHMHYDLGFSMQSVGMLVAVYTAAQLIGRAAFGKFLLPYVKIHRYLIISSLLFALAMIVYIFTQSFFAVALLMAMLGLCDSCIYPSVLGYGMDQLNKVSSGATSFLVTVGAIGIPIGTSLSGILGATFGRYTAITLGPVLLVLLALLIFIVSRMRNQTALAGAQAYAK